MTKATTTVDPNQFVPPGVTETLLSPAGLGLVACGALIIFAKYMDGKTKKGKLATARWGGSGEKNKAAAIACKQIEKQKHNKVALYIGTPKGLKNEMLNGKRYLTIPKDSKTLYFPDAQKGVLIFGSPGSGKSFSSINRLYNSVLNQLLPFAMYDFKFTVQSSPTDDAKGQTPIIAGSAIKQGYDVTVFAPGFEGSAIANPIDFLKSNEDAGMARQLAITVNRNFQMGSNDSGNSFFTNAGDQLVQAVFMFVRGTKYPDIMMCQAVLGLPNLVKRIGKAYDTLNFIVREAFSQFVSVCDSPETAASIVGTASGLFSRFMIPSVLQAFCGKTNIPLDLKKKQLIIFGMNKEQRDVIGPLLAAVLHLLVTRNVAGKRNCPFVLGIDELPTLFLPSLVDWLNQNREDGLCTILGVQNISMLQEAYGDNTTNAIFGGCATKFFFNPQDDISAEKFSKYLGNQEIHYKQNSRSSGGKSGASISKSEQSSTRPLFEISEFNTLPVGKAVIISPQYCSKGQSSLPILQSINVGNDDKNNEAESIKIWYEHQQKLIKNASKRMSVDEEMRLRREEAERLLPMGDTMSTKPTHQEVIEKARAITEM